MLEPLIVLTVLNCFFMFSSTVTTCALWWQYRSHRCCFKKDTAQQGTRHNLSKGKSSNSSKKPTNLKQDNVVNFIGANKTDSSPIRESRCKKSCKQRPRTSAKYLVQSKTTTDERPSSIDTTENWEVAEKARLSEASQTEAKSAVVMEYSTVQKIVQILDDDTDLAATKLVIKDLTAKQTNDEKKGSIIEPMLEHSAESQCIADTTEPYN